MTEALASGEGKDARPEPPHLDLILYPNPPLGRHGTLAVMLAAVLVGGVLGAAFASLGAWPVSGFLGLDVLLLGLALYHTGRRSRRVEIIRLDAAGLTVRRLGPRGDVQSEVRLEPAWVQVVLDERRRQDPRLSLRSHGVSTPIATFLAPAERREIAAELRAALAPFRGRG